MSETTLGKSGYKINSFILTCPFDSHIQKGTEGQRCSLRSTKYFSRKKTHVKTQILMDLRDRITVIFSSISSNTAIFSSSFQTILSYSAM